MSQQGIINFLKKKKKFVSGDEISKGTGVSRSATGRALKKMRDFGEIKWKDINKCGRIAYLYMI